MLLGLAELEHVALSKILFPVLLFKDIFYRCATGLEHSDLYGLAGVS